MWNRKMIPSNLWMRQKSELSEQRCIGAGHAKQHAAEDVALKGMRKIRERVLNHTCL